MNPHRIEIGNKYPDNSGWERHIIVDVQSNEVEIELIESKLFTNVEEIDFIINSLLKAKMLLGIS